MKVSTTHSELVKLPIRFAQILLVVLLLLPGVLATAKPPSEGIVGIKLLNGLGTEVTQLITCQPGQKFVLDFDEFDFGGEYTVQLPPYVDKGTIGITPDGGTMGSLTYSVSGTLATGWLIKFTSATSGQEFKGVAEIPLILENCSIGSPTKVFVFRSSPFINYTGAVFYLGSPLAGEFALSGGILKTQARIAATNPNCSLVNPATYNLFDVGYRYYYINAANGNVNGLTLHINPGGGGEDEIYVTNIEAIQCDGTVLGSLYPPASLPPFVACDNSSYSSYSPLHHLDIPIGATEIAAYALRGAGGNTLSPDNFLSLTSGDFILIRETFNIVRPTSPTCGSYNDNITNYTVTTLCGPSECSGNSINLNAIVPGEVVEIDDADNFAIVTETSAIDCGTKEFDITISFTTPAAGASGVVNSTIMLDEVFIPMDLTYFDLPTSIEVAGVTLAWNAAWYNSTGIHIPATDFVGAGFTGNTTLSDELVPGFHGNPDIGAGTYRWMQPAKTLTIILHGIKFYCTGAGHGPGPYTFMIPGSQSANISYHNACATCAPDITNMTRSFINGLDITGHFAGETFRCENDITDLDGTGPATLSFNYRHLPTDEPTHGNPWQLSTGGGLPYNEFFTCTPEYIATVSLPATSTLGFTSAISVTDNGVTNTYPIPGSFPTAEFPDKNTFVYVYTGLVDINISFQVNMTCGGPVFGLEHVTSNFQVRCASCTMCTRDLGTCGVDVFFHCPGSCGSGSIPTISNFDFYRKTFGWDAMANYDPCNPTYTTIPAAAAADWELNRVYDMDEIHGHADGGFNNYGGVLTVAANNYFLNFDIARVVPIDYHYELVSGRFTFNDGSGDVFVDFPSATFPFTGEVNAGPAATEPHWVGMGVGDVHRVQIPHGALTTGSLDIYNYLDAATGIVSVKFDGEYIIVVGTSPSPAVGSHFDGTIRAQFTVDHSAPLPVPYDDVLWHSCDPYGDVMDYIHLEPRVDINEVVDNQQTFWSHLDGLNDIDFELPAGTSDCNLRYLYMVNVDGSFVDDYETLTPPMDEQRPYFRWTDQTLSPAFKLTNSSTRYLLVGADMVYQFGPGQLDYTLTPLVLGAAGDIEQNATNNEVDLHLLDPDAYLNDITEFNRQGILLTFQKACNYEDVTGDKFYVDPSNLTDKMMYAEVYNTSSTCATLVPYMPADKILDMPVNTATSPVEIVPTSGAHIVDDLAGNTADATLQATSGSADYVWFKVEDITTADATITSLTYDIGGGSPFTITSGALVTIGTVDAISEINFHVTADLNGCHGVQNIIRITYGSLCSADLFAALDASTPITGCSQTYVITMQPRLNVAPVIHYSSSLVPSSGLGSGCTGGEDVFEYRFKMEPPVSGSSNISIYDPTLFFRPPLGLGLIEAESEIVVYSGSATTYTPVSTGALLDAHYLPPTMSAIGLAYQVRLNPALHPNIRIGQGEYIEFVLRFKICTGTTFPGDKIPALPAAYSVKDMCGNSLTPQGTFTFPLIDYSAATICQNGDCPILDVICHQEDECGPNNASAWVEIVDFNAGYTYWYGWVKGSTTYTTSTVTGLHDGDHLQVWVIDETGALGTCTIDIDEFPPVAVTSTITHVRCNSESNGAIVLTVTSGAPTGTFPYFTFDWSDNGTIHTKDRTGLAAGPYTVTVTDANGCTTSATIIVTEPATLAVTFNSLHHVSCYGVCDGIIDINNPTGGTSPYTYAWVYSGTGSGTATTQDLTGLCAGTYDATVTVTDAHGCTVDLPLDDQVITEPAALTLDLVAGSIHNIDCAPDGSQICNGTAQVTIGGGTAPYTYTGGGGGTWTTDGTYTVINLCWGSNIIHVTDAHGCPIDLDIVLEPLDIAEVIVNPHCHKTCDNVCDGSIDITVTGGVAPYSYYWGMAPYTGSTLTWSHTEDPTQLCAGTYRVTVTDAHGCTAIAEYTLTQPDEIVITVTSVTNVTCYGGSDGAIDITVTGGTQFPIAPHYTYSWPGGITDEDRTGLTAGTYVVTVVDANGCSRTKSITITEPTELVAIEVSHTNASCNAGGDGTALINITGGTPGYTSSHGTVTGSTVVVNTLSAGSYDITITDAHGCTDVVNVIITEPTAIDITGAATDANCHGSCDGAVGITVSGGTSPYTYLWGISPYGTGFIWALDEDISNLCAGTYKVVVTDANGCTAEHEYIVGEPAELIVTVTSTTEASCFGGADGTAILEVSGGTPIYTTDMGTIVGTTITITGLTAGVHTVTVTDAHGCTASVDVTITGPGGLTATLNTKTDPNCNGTTDGSILIDISGGVSPYSSNIGIVTGSSLSHTGIGAGLYHFIITDLNGCQTTLDVTLTNPDVLVVDLTSQTDVSCHGGADGTATFTISGGTPAYTCGTGIVTGNILVVSNLSAGTYSFTVTDAHGCTATTSVTIDEPDALSIGEVVVNATCHGSCDGSIDITVTGGVGAYTYLWGISPYGVGFIWAFDEDVSNLCAGTYKVIVTDENGCTAEEEYTITEPDALSANITAQTNVSCFGGNNGSVTIAVTGGTGAYSSSMGIVTGSNVDINTLTAGTYHVTITDANNCSIVVDVVITEPDELTLAITAQTNITCNGANNGTVEITITGGTATYSSNVGTPVGNILTLTGLTPGHHTITITDAHGCHTDIDVNILEPDVLTVTLVSQTDVSCPGGSNGTATFEISGGTTVYTADMGTVTGTTLVVTGLSATIHTVTVTDANGCTASQSVTIGTVPALSISTPPAVTVSCHDACDADIDITVTGGTTAYTYHWENPAYAYVWTTQDLTNMCAGTYNLTVTDANGCTETATVTVDNPDALVGTVTAHTDVDCHGGSNGTATITITGGVPAYGASSGTLVVDEVFFTGLPAGTHTITITDAHGCSTDVDIVIEEPDEIILNIASHKNVSCNGLSDGGGTIVIAGGVGPYSASCGSVAGNVVTYSGLSAGSYFCTITDAHSCTAEINIVVTEPDVLVVTLTSQTDVSCTGGSNGTATFTISGGTPMYVPDAGVITGITTLTLTGLPAGTHWVTVTDINGCTATQSVTIEEVDGILIDVPVGLSTNCQGDCDVDVDITVTGGTAPFTYNWHNPAFSYVWTTEDLTDMCAGTYNLTVTDVNGCTATASVTIDGPSSPIDLDVVSVTGEGCVPTVCDGSFEIVVTGGVAPYSYSYTGPSGPGSGTVPTSGGSIIATTLCAGTYSVTVVDDNGCTSYVEVSVSPCADCLFGLIENDDYYVIDGSNNYINSDMSWQKKYYIAANVTVDNAVLDITNTDVLFAEGMSITFINDARLRSSNSTYRPCNELEVWTGLVFNDNSSGIINECLFKNAVTAVDVNSNQSVRLSNNNFTNCAISVNIQANALPYESTITGNTFLFNLDNPYPYTGYYTSSDYFGIAIQSRLVSGLIGQNDFVNQYNPSGAGPDYYYGVFGIEAGFTASTNKFTDIFRCFSVAHNASAINISDNEMNYSENYSTANFPIAPINNRLLVPIWMRECNDIGGVYIERNKFTDNSGAAATFPAHFSVAIIIDSWLTNSAPTTTSENIYITENFINNFAFGVAAFNAVNIHSLRNTVQDGFTGIYYFNCVHDAIIDGNSLHMNNLLTGNGINYIMDEAWFADYDPLSVIINDNCIYDTRAAMSLSFTYGAIVFGPADIPVIRENYMANYRTHGLYISEFVGDIGNPVCASTTLDDYGKNSFVSNFVDFGSAFNIFATSPTVNSRGNYLYSLASGVNTNVNMVVCNDLTPGMAASCGIISGPMFDFSYVVQELFVEEKYPLSKVDKDYVLKMGYLGTIDAQKNKYDYAVSVMEALSHNSTFAELDKCYTGLMNASFLGAQQKAWLTFKYHTVKKDFSSAYKSLANITPAGKDEEELKGIEEIRMKYTGGVSIKKATADERSFLVAVDTRKGLYADYARDMMQSITGDFHAIMPEFFLPEMKTEERRLVGNAISVYPNPTNGKLTVEYSMDSPNGEIKVVDVLGRILAVYPVDKMSGHVNIDMTNLVPGVYMITMESDANFSEVVKVVKTSTKN